MNQQKIGQFLKKLRNEKSVTQAELAEVLGVSNRSISRWENGTTMPDFDLLIELAKYYDVEVGEILDGERKEDNMDIKTEKLMLKIADYNNVEKDFFSKRMCVMFTIALIGMAVYMVIDLMGLSADEPYETVVSIALGFVVGTLLTGLLYASRYIVKLKEAKMRMMKNLRRLK
ncbi:MAG: helix-turn-helix domain-containing protein [Lachnospiraceae bacterium]|nr:helix-turn-helix domain-containing protein [Lachnospiraceae bacterium]